MFIDIDLSTLLFFNSWLLVRSNKLLQGVPKIPH